MSDVEKNLRLLGSPHARVTAFQVMPLVRALYNGRIPPIELFTSEAMARLARVMTRRPWGDVNSLACAVFHKGTEKIPELAPLVIECFPQLMIISQPLQFQFAKAKGKWRVIISHLVNSTLREFQLLQEEFHRLR